MSFHNDKGRLRAPFLFLFSLIYLTQFSCASNDVTTEPSWLTEGVLGEGQIYTFVVESTGLDRLNSLPTAAGKITSNLQSILAQEAGEVIFDEELLGEFFRTVEEDIQEALGQEGRSELVSGLLLVDEYSVESEPFGTYFYYLRLNSASFLDLIDFDSLALASDFGNQEILELSGEEALERLLQGFEEAYGILSDQESFDSQRFEALLNDIELILSSLRITVTPEILTRNLGEEENSTFAFTLSFGNASNPMPLAPVQVSSRVLGSTGRPVVRGLSLTSDEQGQGEFEIEDSGLPGLEDLRVLLNLSGRIPRLLSADRRYHQRVFALERMLILRSAQSQILNLTPFSNQTWNLNPSFGEGLGEGDFSTLFQDTFTRELTRHGLGREVEILVEAEIILSVNVTQREVNSGAGFSVVLEGVMDLDGSAISEDLQITRVVSGRSESNLKEAQDLGISALAKELGNELRLLLR